MILTQDTFVAILRRPFEIVNEAATAMYLRRVAYHLLIDYRRKHRRVVLVKKSTPRINFGCDGLAEKTEDEIFEYLKGCFERLTDRAQLALKMRFRDKATREQIAEALNISANGAKNLMQRAKIQLKECIDTRVKDREDPQ